MKDVLLIGATGFIGNEVTRRFAGTGVRLRLLAHHNRPEVPASANFEQLNGGIQTFDWQRLDDDLPDTIIHLARISGKSTSGRYLAGIRGYRANKRLLDWSRSHTTPPHIIYASGTLVYGSQGDSPVDERAPVRPISFQRSYIRAEKPFFSTSGLPDKHVSILRPPWVYGPGSWFKQFYHDVMEREGCVPQYGDGKNYMSLVSLNDCTRMIVEIARKSNGGAIYNLHAGKTLQQCDFCEILSRLTGKPVRMRTNRWLRTKYGRVVTEALTFSLIVTSIHPLINEFRHSCQNHRKGLETTLQVLQNPKGKFQSCSATGY